MDGFARQVNADKPVFFNLLQVIFLSMAAPGVSALDIPCETGYIPGLTLSRSDEHMEKREHPRVQVPLEVEVTHPALGSLRTFARNVSAGGIFVSLQNARISVGAKLKVTTLNVPLIESRPTPTIQMEVKRVEESGLGLAFVNKSNRHLWETVEQLRKELAVGRDYFQVFQAALVVNDANRLLVVQQNGKWLFPGDYLVVGQHWETALQQTLSKQLGISDARHQETLAIDSDTDSQLEEAALFSVFHRLRTPSSQFRLNKTSSYKNAKWVGRAGDLDELTFSHKQLRELATTALAHTGQPAQDEGS